MVVFCEINSKKQRCRGKQQGYRKVHAAAGKRIHGGNGCKMGIPLCKGNNRIYYLRQNYEAIY